MHPHDSHLSHGELDGGVGDEHEGGLGAVPQGGDALLHPDLTQAVEKSSVPVQWATEASKNRSFFQEISWEFLFCDLLATLVPEGPNQPF